MGASSASDTVPHNDAWLMTRMQKVTIYTSPIALSITAVPIRACHTYLPGQPDAVQVSYPLHVSHD